MTSYNMITSDIEDIAKVINKKLPESIVLLDVDDTLITPDTRLFEVLPGQEDSQGNLLIETIKKKRLAIPGWDQKISQWRLSRKVSLIHQRWPSFINEWQQKGLLVYGLTQMDTGSCGKITSQEEWRYHELKRLGISFTQTFCGKEKILLLLEKGLPSSDSKGDAFFYKGIMSTGSFLKNQVVHSILTGSIPSLVFVDDRPHQVKAVGEVCKSKNIPYTGIIFRGVEKVKKCPLSHEMIPLVIAWQKHAIEKGEQWIEDDEVETALKSAL